MSTGDGGGRKLLRRVAKKKGSTEMSHVKMLIGKKGVVKLNDGTEYFGIITGIDTYMNVSCVDVIEVENGKQVGNYKDLFIRGNNVWYVGQD